MQILIQGYKRFHSHVFPQKRRHYRKLAQGQSPEFLLITCCDSRVLPSEFTSHQAGDLFEDRSLGNIIPEAGTGDVEARAVVEYAVIALEVKHIIVCGHSDCGAMKGLLDPELLKRMPLVASWLEHAKETLDRVERKYPHLGGTARLEATVRENVMVQVERIGRMPFVAERIAAGTIDLHGWVFEIEHGRVVAHDPRVGRFVALTEAYAPLRV